MIMIMHPVTVDWVALQACTISASCPGQLAFLSSPSFLIILIMVWCDLSTSPLVWGVVRHGPLFLHAEDLAQFVDDAPHKVSTSIIQESGQGPKEQDVTLIQELVDGFRLFDWGSHTPICAS